MANTDAKILPIKNQAYRVTFSLLDADGILLPERLDLIAKSLRMRGRSRTAPARRRRSRRLVACIIGSYATEMNADTVAVIVKTTSRGENNHVGFLSLEDADLQ